VTPLVVHVETPEDMRRFGAALGRTVEPGDRLFLEGPFGAGKTTFVQGLAIGLGVSEPVSSPSFVIETQYRGRLRLYHVDLYRLDAIEPELRENLEEHLFGGGVTAVEWAERLPDDLRDGATVLRFAPDDEDRTRRVEVTTEREPIRRAASGAW
jgi:tRNA threonylcarbamoyladenosine biosynthesis protein TsaE